MMRRPYRRHLDRIRWAWQVAVVVALMGCGNQEVPPSAAVEKVAGCVQAVFSQTKPSKVTNALIHETARVCQAMLRDEGLLRDFELRRKKFDSQAYQEGILLWMVVTITVAGVALAGLQLFMAYKLATVGSGDLAESNSLYIERGKLSVKSSVTGLLVLICSFAFFWVFVREIYVIKPIDVDRGEYSEKSADRPSTNPLQNGQTGAGPLVSDPLPIP